MELYDNIRKYRLQLGLTQDQLARLTGYTDRSSIAKIEKGLVDISQSKLELFAQVLHVSAGTLIGKSSVDSFVPVSAADQLTASEQALLSDFRQLNEEGQEKILDYARDLVSSGRYIKIDQPGLVDEKA